MRSRLLEQIRSLGPRAPMDGLPRSLDGDAAPGALPDAGELQRAVGAFLAELAERVERELPEVLGKAWDQIDSLVLLDAGWVVSADTNASAVVSTAASADVAQVRRDLCRGALAVRNRRPGDRFRPVGLGGQKKLQDYFVDRKVAPVEVLLPEPYVISTSVLLL